MDGDKEYDAATSDDDHGHDDEKMTTLMKMPTLSKVFSAHPDLLAADTLPCLRARTRSYGVPNARWGVKVNILKM